MSSYGIHDELSLVAVGVVEQAGYKFTDDAEISHSTGSTLTKVVKDFYYSACVISDDDDIQAATVCF
jgi:hypothetical protein